MNNAAHPELLPLAIKKHGLSPSTKVFFDPGTMKLQYGASGVSQSFHPFTDLTGGEHKPPQRPRSFPTPTHVLYG